MKQKITILSFMLLVTAFTFAQEAEEKSYEYPKRLLIEDRELLPEGFREKQPTNFHHELPQKADQRHHLNLPRKSEKMDYLEFDITKKDQTTLKSLLKSTSSKREKLDSVTWDVWNPGTSVWKDSLKREGTLDPIENKQTYFEYKYDETTGEWNEIMKVERSYDYSGNVILFQVFMWDKENSQYINDEKKEYDFDADGNETLNAEYTWDESLGQWIGTRKEEFAWDGSGNKTLEAYYNEWDTINAQWIGDYKYERAYDAYGNTTLYAYYSAWDSTNEQWIGDLKEEYAYDANGNMTLVVWYEWEETAGVWINGWKDEYLYNTNGKNTIVFRYAWEETGGEWINEWKYEYLYNAEMDKESDQIYYWDIETNQWQHQYKLEYTYDANGILIHDIRYIRYWWNSDPLWHGEWKTEYAYDSDANLTQELVYGYDDDTNEWTIKSSKNEYSYDTSGNKILEESYGWDTANAQWTGNLKEEYAYDANGRQTLYAGYEWDENLAQWIGTFKKENAYDANGNTTLYAYYYDWDSTNAQWVGYYKQEYSFDANDNSTLYEYFEWDTENAQWTENYRGEYAYDANGNPSQQAWFNWDANTSEWIGDDKINLTYDLTVSLSDLEGYLFSFYKPAFYHKTVNKPTGYESFNWDNNSNQWVQTDQFTYHYSEFNGSLTTGGATCEEAMEAVPGTNKAVFEADEWGNVTNEQWYHFTATQDGIVSLSSSEIIEAYTYITVFDGCGGEEIAYSDDNNPDLPIAVSFEAEEGETYHIRWNTDQESDISWTLKERAFKKGETAENPLVAIPGTNFANHWEGGSDAYFIYTATSNGYMEVTTCGLTGVDTYLEIYNSIDNSLITRVDDICEGQAKSVIEVIEGESYLIKWDNRYVDAQATYPWELNFTTTPPDAGTVCANPIMAEEGSNTTVFADQWLIYYQYTASMDGRVLLYLEDNTSEDIGFYITRDCSDLDNDYPTYYSSDTTFFWAQQGETYNVLIYNDEGHSVTTDNIDWNLEIRDEEQIIVPGNSCSSALTASTGLNTTDNSQGDVWYTFTPATNGYLNISSCGLTNEDTYLAVYNNCDFEMIDRSDDECSYQSEVLFAAEAGNDYYIRWGNNFTSGVYDWNLALLSGTDFRTFGVEYQAGDISIDESNHTITVNVSTDADITNLSQYFTVIDGAEVSVGGNPVSSGQPLNFSAPVTYTVTSPDGLEAQDWVVTVNQNETYLSEKDILSFSIEYQAAAATFDGTTIDVEMEWGYISSYCPEIRFSLSPLATLEYNGGYVSDNDVLCDLNIGQNILTVYAEDGSSQDWVLNITEKPEPAGSACENAVTTGTGQNTGVRAGDQSQWFQYTPSEDGVLTIELLNGGSWTNLYTGCGQLRDQEDHSGPGEPARFVVSGLNTYYFYFETENPEYIFNISEDQLSSENDIEWFYFNNADIVSRTINNETHTVNILLSYGSSASSLETEFELSDGATAYINGIEQDPYGEIINFNAPVTYHVEAMDGTTQNWEVTVNIRNPETGTDIQYFTLGEALAPASINPDDKTVTIWVTPGTDLNSCIPFFSLSKGAHMYHNSEVVFSGITGIDLSSIINVSVEAENGTTQTWAVEVKAEAAVMVTSISVTSEGDETSIDTDGGTLKMTAAILPENATIQAVTWYVENGTGKATIDQNGILKAIANGTVTVKATANDGSGITGEKEIAIQGQTTGILVAEHVEFSIYPNPTQSVCYLSSDNAMGQTFSYQLIDLKGNVLMAKSAVTYQGTEEIDLSHVVPGVYLLQIRIGEKFMVKKVIRR